MGSKKRAVYFICNNPSWGHVSHIIWDILGEEGYLAEETDVVFAGKKAMKKTDEEGNEFWYVPTDIALCRDYPRYLPDLNKYFADFDISGMIT